MKVKNRQEGVLQARAHLESTARLSEAFGTAQQRSLAVRRTLDLSTTDERDREYQLSVLVRSGWITPGSQTIAAAHEVLPGMGAPASCLRGQLSELGEPGSIQIEDRYWFTPYHHLAIDPRGCEAFHRFVALFWCGE